MVMGVNGNALRRYGDYFIFAGHAQGFYTKINSASFTNNKHNAFVMKYLFDKETSTSCVYEAEVATTTISGTVTDGGSSSSYVAVETSLTTSSTALIYYSKYYAAYSSPYSGAFDLLETQYIPRPCATRSVNMTQMDYFYG